MAELRVGKGDVKPDAPAHTPGVYQGNAKGNYEKQAGHYPDGRSGAEPIDPRMPNLSPG